MVVNIWRLSHFTAHDLPLKRPDMEKEAENGFFFNAQV